MRDSRRSRDSIKSRISRYSNNELIQEMQCCGLQTIIISHCSNDNKCHSTPSRLKMSPPRQWSPQGKDDYCKCLGDSGGGRGGASLLGRPPKYPSHRLWQSTPPTATPTKTQEATPLLGHLCTRFKCTVRHCRVHHPRCLGNIL